MLPGDRPLGMVRAVSGTWNALYASDLQGCWALLPVPALYLLWRGLAGRPRSAGALPAAAGFLDAYAIAFAVETMLDPLATGPLMRALGVGDGALGTAVMIVFVLLGDFRVYLLVFALLAIADGRSWRSGVTVAVAWTLLVPVIAYPLSVAARATWPRADANSIWLIYETLFAIVALTLRARLVPRRASDQPALCAFLREALAYAAAYYGLWAAADALIQIGGLDVGWLLRMAPNQLYYAFWIPFVVLRFFARR